MTNNNYDTPGKDEQWEPSTANKDKADEKTSIAIKACGKTISAVNTAIKGFNNSIGWAAKKAGYNWTIDELDESKIISAVQSGQGVGFALGATEEIVKLARNGLNVLDVWPISYLVKGIQFSLGLVEFNIDRLKDLSGDLALSSLSANIGDLKEGQAKLNAKVDAQGKRLSEKMNGIKSELEKNLNEAKKDLENQIKNADEEQKKELKKAKEELQRQIEGVQDSLNQVERQLTNALNDFRNEVNDRFEAQEHKNP